MKGSRRLSDDIAVLSFYGSGQFDEFLFARSVKEEGAAKNLHHGGTGFKGELGSNRLSISQATLLDSHLDKFVFLQCFLGGFNHFFVEVMFTDHDEGAQAMPLAT